MLGTLFRAPTCSERDLFVLYGAKSPCSVIEDIADREVKLSDGIVKFGHVDMRLRVKGVVGEEKSEPGEIVVGCSPPGYEARSREYLLGYGLSERTKVCKLCTF